ncbi:MAG: hypothetical protein HYZ53_26740 [Planctomycetes bacterium]|nr:hypothetical protein [Planctomycetota bacterium]
METLEDLQKELAESRRENDALPQTVAELLELDASGDVVVKPYGEAFPPETHSWLGAVLEETHQHDFAIERHVTVKLPHAHDLPQGEVGKCSTFTMLLPIRKEPKGGTDLLKFREQGAGAALPRWLRRPVARRN